MIEEEWPCGDRCYWATIRTMARMRNLDLYCRVLVPLAYLAYVITMLIEVDWFGSAYDARVDEAMAKCASKPDIFAWK